MFSIAVRIFTRVGDSRFENSFDEIIMECLVPVYRALLKPLQALLELDHQSVSCNVFLHLKTRKHFDVNFLFNLGLQKRGLYVESISVLFRCDRYKYAPTADTTNWCKCPPAIHDALCRYIVNVKTLTVRATSNQPALSSYIAKLGCVRFHLHERPGSNSWKSAHIRLIAVKFEVRICESSTERRYLLTK